MSGVLGWGKATSGQLGLKGEEVAQVTLPRQIPNLRGSDIQDIACGENHTLVCMQNGSLYSCGNNDFDQLGHNKSTKRFESVDNKSLQRVKQVSAGSFHSMALTHAHEVFTWGSNEYGQLGRGSITDEQRGIPKLIKTLAVHTVTQISSGSRHCLILTNESLVATWGSNEHGQLGLGNIGGKRDIPEFLTCLHGIPIAQVVAGGYHNFTLSMSGAIHGWGKNSAGQLGFSVLTDHSSPQTCRSLRNQKIKYLSCGEDHTAALTTDGRVFTFGAGSYGQLGHGSTCNEILPRQVMELSGEEVIQIACGRRHTLAYVKNSGRLYSFGLGGSGQLGIDDTGNRNTPCRVHGPFVPESPTGQTDMQVDDESMSLVVQRIFTGGDHCFIIYRPSDMEGEVSDYRQFNCKKRIATLTPDHLTSIELLMSDEDPPIELSEEIQKIFSNTSCLNGSFLLPNDKHYGSSSKNHGVDMDQVQETFLRLEHAPNIIIRQKICTILENLMRLLPTAPPDIEALRIFLILPECHYFDQPKYYSTLMTPFGKAIINLDKTAAKFLSQWWSKLAPSRFNHLVQIYKQCIEFLLQLPDTEGAVEVEKRQCALYVSLEMLKRLNTVNEEHKQIIPHHRFYVQELKDRVNIQKDYVSWVQQSGRQQHVGGVVTQVHCLFVMYSLFFSLPLK